MGRRKNSKGTVSIDKDKSVIRLRWRYLSKGYSLNLFLYNKPNLLQAKNIALSIENDIAISAFDDSLKRYKDLIPQPPHQHSLENSICNTPARKISKEKLDVSDSPVNILKDFDRYITA